jgi:hypothetical protein
MIFSLHQNSQDAIEASTLVNQGLYQSTLDGSFSILLSLSGLSSTGCFFLN